MKKTFVIIASVYLSIGLLFALYNWSQDIRTFTCGDTVVQHTYNFTTGTGSFRNPDPDRCVRRGFELRSIVTVPYFIIAWPIVIARDADTGDLDVETSLFSDRVDIPGLGIFHDSPAQNGLKSYESERLAISLNYPENYRLFEGQGQGSYEYYVITISPEPYISEIIASDADTEWPASIQLLFYREPNLSVSLEEWIRTKRQSNFDISDPAQEGTFTPTTVADVPALQYAVIGLYDFEYTAFLHGKWVVLAANPGVGEHINQDFKTVLSSIKFSL